MFDVDSSNTLKIIKLDPHVLLGHTPMLVGILMDKKSMDISKDDFLLI